MLGRKVSHYRKRKFSDPSEEMIPSLEWRELEVEERTVDLWAAATW